MPKSTHCGDFQNPPRQNDPTTIGELTILFGSPFSCCVFLKTVNTVDNPRLNLRMNPNLIYKPVYIRILKYNRVETENEQLQTKIQSRQQAYKTVETNKTENQSTRL